MQGSLLYFIHNYILMIHRIKFTCHCENQSSDVKLKINKNEYLKASQNYRDFRRKDRYFWCFIHFN